MSEKHKGEGCVVTCGADVGVKLNPKPEVECHEVDRRGTSFGVALKTKVNPKCKITYQGSKTNSCDPCEHTCYFKVQLDADCDAEIVNTACGNPTLDYKMKVRVPVSPECKVGNICKDKPVKKDHDRHHGMAVDTKKKASPKVALSSKKSNSYVAQLAKSSSSRKSTITA